MIQHIRRTLSAAILLLLPVSIAEAAPSVSVSPSGSTSCIIQGYGMDGVSGMNLSLSYDTSLSGLSVIQGGLVSGAMLVANTNTPGSITIGILKAPGTFSGNGPIATVTFTNGSGSLRLVTANLINSNGASISGSTSGSCSIATSSTLLAPLNEQTASNTSQTSAGTSTGTYLGSVTMQTDAQAQTAPKQAETPNTPAETTTAATAATPSDQQTAAKADKPKKPEEQKLTTYTSVLERFRTYQGEKNPAILVALFSKEVAPLITQTPLAALSDGSTPVRITVRLSPSRECAPNFALSGVQLVSLNKDDETGAWILETLPLANTLKAGITILNGNEVIEFPLTVAPPIKTATIGEASFAAFLKNNGKSADLNNDGKRDYIDDYIFTANYLAQKSATKQHNQGNMPQR